MSHYVSTTLLILNFLINTHKDPVRDFKVKEKQITLRKNDREFK